MQQKITKLLSITLAAMLCLTPEMVSAAAQQNPQSPTPPQQSTAQTEPANSQNETPAGQEQQPAPQNRNGQVNPSQPPLAPVTTYPEAPTPQQQEQNTTQQTPTTTTTVPTPQTQKPVTEPVGAAAAEKVPTAGGAASKPAGAAIAPAKQHQTRALLFKIGAIAAGGLAAGTIYALSRGTPSKPPGAGTTGTTQK